MNNMRTGPSRLSALSPSRNDAQQSPVAQLPVVPQQLPVVPQQSPGAPQQSPVAPQQSPVAPQQSPGAPQQSPGAPQQSPVAPQQTGWDICTILLIVVAYLVSTPVGLWLALVSFETAGQYGWCTPSEVHPTCACNHLVPNSLVANRLVGGLQDLAWVHAFMLSSD